VEYPSFRDTFGNHVAGGDSMPDATFDFAWRIDASKSAWNLAFPRNALRSVFLTFFTSFLSFTIFNGLRGVVLPGDRARIDRQRQSSSAPGVTPVPGTLAKAPESEDEKRGCNFAESANLNPRKVKDRMRMHRKSERIFTAYSQLLSLYFIAICTRQGSNLQPCDPKSYSSFRIAE
jgi:hypothetical protein